MKVVVFLLSVVCLDPARAASGLPVVFIPNAGQADESVHFAVETPDVRAAFTGDGLLLASRGAHLRMRFLGGVNASRPQGVMQLEARANFLRGSDPSAWRSGIPTFGQIEYPKFYPGIDISWGSAGPRLKSEFHVAPEANPLAIRWEYEGVSEVRVEPDGALFLRSGQIELREFAPVAYVELPDGSRRETNVRYRVYGDKSVGFDLDPYDRSLPLVIDPEIVYSTYIGGSGSGAVTGVARDNDGNLYAAGWTDSLSFPIAGALQAANRGGVDAFVVKLNPSGNQLLYATYIGGNGDDRAAGIAVDSSGQAHVAGATGSSNFPLQNAARSSFVGGREGFALKLNAAGSALVYSTYLGGSNYDVATAVALDAGGNAYVAGDTYSSNFPLLYPVQASHGGGADAFVTRLNPSGVIAFSTYLGGSLDEHAGGIAAGASDVVYVTGGTFSTNFPVAGAIQSSNAGGQDAFVAKLLTASYSQILYSTYLGGSGGTIASPEQANAIAADAAGNAYIAGVVSSTDFPVTAGAFQTGAAGSRDIFVTKLNAAGNARLYSTYIGWSGFDWASGIAVDASGNAHIVGHTSSVGFANVGGVQAEFKGLYDGFILKLNSAGSALSFSTPFGGTLSDQINAVALDGNGNIFVGGQTSSTDLPTQAALQGSRPGDSSGWLALLGDAPPPTGTPVADSADVVYLSSNQITLTAKFSHPAGAAAIAGAGVLLSTGGSGDSACMVWYDAAANTFWLANDVASSGSTPVTPGSGIAQNSQCQLRGVGTSAAAAGNTLTLTLSVVLTSGFPGNNNVWLYAASVNANTGWVLKPGRSAVSADSVAPNSSGGTSAVFTFVFSDTKDPANVQTTAMLIGTDTSGVNACWLVFDRARERMSLLWDSPTGSHAKPMGSTANIKNSQCALGAPALSTSGNSTILTVPLAFYGAFTGPKNIYMYAVGPNGNTGWVQRGTFNVIAGGRPVAQSVSPASGSAPSQTFSFTISEQGGSDHLWAAAMLFSRSSNFDLNNGCYVLWDRTTSRFSLFRDLYTNGANSLNVGASGLLGNSQCILNGTGSSVSIDATTITITLNLTFSAAFAGNKNSFLYASENGYNSGWQHVGTWTVPGSPPAINPLTPSSGSGNTTTFTMSATTPVSPSDVTGMGMLITAGGTVNSCYVRYDRAASVIGLYNDDATSLATKPIGSSANLQNSQCAIGFSVVTVNGGTINVNVQIVFKPAFSGAKTVYVGAENIWGGTPLTARGTWTVP